MQCNMCFLCVKFTSNYGMESKPLILIFKLLHDYNLELIPQ